MRKKTNKITMTDIARRLGLSQPYVSKIINGKEPNASEETRRRVLDLVRELEYEPDYVASSLRSGRKMCIGVGGTGSLGHIHRYAPAWIYSGIGGVADGRRYYLTFFPLSSDLEDSLVRIVKSRMVDGMVFVIPSFLHGVFSERKVPLLHREGMPFVLVHYDTYPYDCHNVGYDRAEAGRTGVRALVECGVTDIGVVGREAGRSKGSGIWDGACEEASRAGCRIRDLRFPDGAELDAAGGYRTGAAFARRGGLPQGLLVHNDLIATGLVKAFRDNGIGVPGDCAVVTVGSAFNDGFMGVPELPTVEMPYKEMGRRAAEILFSVLDGKRADGPYHTEILRPELITPRVPE